MSEWVLDQCLINGALILTEGLNPKLILALVLSLKFIFKSQFDC
jgi:hypothetical protein